MIVYLCVSCSTLRMSYYVTTYLYKSIKSPYVYSDHLLLNLFFILLIDLCHNWRYIMSILILNAQRTRDSGHVDRFITDTFNEYIWQYATIPDQLILIDPQTATDSAILLVDKSCENEMYHDVDSAKIRFALYHPFNEEPIYFETNLQCTSLMHVSCAQPISEQLVDENIISLREWLTLLKNEYPAQVEVPDHRKAEIIKQYSFKCQSLHLH